MSAPAGLPDVAAASVYERLGGQLDALIPSFGLAGDRPLIRRAYELLCGESLRLPVGVRPLRGSRLNADGTPFQLALTLGASASPLQFVAEPGPTDARNAERATAARSCIPRLARLVGATEWLPRIFELLDRMAPAHDPDLLGDEAGAVWIGAAFAPARTPRLKVYVNAKWGAEAARWDRLATFANDAGFGGEWRGIRARVEQLEPLGVSLTVAAGAPPAARIYLSGYGRSFGYHEALAGACGGPSFARLLGRYGETLLEDDYRNPTRSAVWSVASEAGSIVDLKFELCAHCAFDSDARARACCVEWLREMAVSPALYLRVVDALSRDRPGGAAASLHQYVGVGVRRARPYSTFYFNPAAGLR